MHSAEPIGVEPSNASLGCSQVDFGVVPGSASLGHSQVSCGAVPGFQSSGCSQGDETVGWNHLTRDEEAVRLTV